MSHVDPRPTRPGAWVAVLSLLCALAFAGPASAQDPVYAPFRVVPESPCTFDDVRAVFSICTCNTRILSAVRVDEVDARLDVEENPLIYCVRCAPDTIGVDFGRLPAGPHQLGGIVVRHIVAGPDSGTTRTEYFTQQFTVRSDCGEPPVPLPWLTDVRVGAACDSCPPEPCAGDSLLVRLKGVFNDPCYAVVGLSASPNPSASPLPQPDVVRIVYEHDPCTPCPAILTPWSGALPIGPLPTGDYRLPVEAWLRERCPGGVADSLVFLGRTSFPFKVSPCGPEGPCYLAAFEKKAPIECTDVVGPDNPGEATLLFQSTVALGGAQGRLVFSGPGLRVIGIDPVLQGTLIKWDPTDFGANFVAVLPSTLRSDLQPVPLIRVRVGLAPGMTLTNAVRLSPEELLVSDTYGNAVPRCDISNLRLVDPAARFCPEGRCDFNNDGHADVRDLVLLVNCVQLQGRSCPWNADCDEDGNLDVDDVLCCARSILGGSRPDSTGAVPAPEVAVEFGAPVPTADGVDVSVRLIARQRIGAATLDFTYPDAAFVDASIELSEPAPNWLVLHESSAGGLKLGAIRLSPDQQITTEVNPSLWFTIHLIRRTGSGVSGAVSFVSGDFSDPNGAVLVTSAAPLSMPLGAGAALSVGMAHPNPFGRETRFSVSLSRNSDHLDVSIYDLAGRKVATLWNGSAVAGTHNLVWRRVRDDGTIVPSGMYFYRATSEGKSEGGKVLVLSRE